MKCRELKVALEKLMAEHPDAADLEVRTEGCDCDGDGDVALARYEPAQSGAYLTDPSTTWSQPADIYLIHTDSREAGRMEEDKE